MDFIYVLGTPMIRSQWERILLTFHRDVDRLCIEIEVTLLCDIFFQYHNDVLAIT